jgi:hypothetical protein
LSNAADLRRAVLACFSDRAAFCGLLDIITKEGKRQKLVLSKAQKRSLRERALRLIVLKSRQIGQTTLEQALDVHHFITRSGSNTVVVCQSIEGHQPRSTISRRFEIMFEGLERLGVKLDFEQRSESRWVLRHGREPNSVLQIIEAGASKASAQKKGRVDTITRLHLTEMSVWEYADETINALLECVPAPETGSEVVSESTPFGASGKFYEQCQEALSGKSGYEIQFFPWFESAEYAVPLIAGENASPRTEREKALVELKGVTPEQLKWYHRKLAEKGSQELVDQEYPSDPDTCFLVSGRSFFDAKRVAVMLAAARPPTRNIEVREAGIAQMRDGKAEVPAIRVWHEPVPREEYVVVCDTSEGTGGSASGALVLERRSARHMATLWAQIPPWGLARFAVALAKKFNGALLVVERNNHGHTVLRAAAAEQKYKRIFCDRDERPGWLTNAVTRAPSLDTLEEAVRAQYFTTNDVHLLREMRTFVVDDKGKAKGAKGARDDLVMMLAIGYDVLCRSVKKKRSGWIDELPPA